jgi:hypothetical protein
MSYALWTVGTAGFRESGRWWRRRFPCCCGLTRPGAPVEDTSDQPPKLLLTRRQPVGRAPTALARLLPPRFTAQRSPSTLRGGATSHRRRLLRPGSRGAGGVPDRGRPGGVGRGCHPPVPAPRIRTWPSTPRVEHQDPSAGHFERARVSSPLVLGSAARTDLLGLVELVIGLGQRHHAPRPRGSRPTRIPCRLASTA